MYYLVYYMSLPEEADLIRVSERECHSFMALNRASDVSAADWPSLSQRHVKNYRYRCY